MAWCPHEPRVLLTTGYRSLEPHFQANVGDDRRSVCWESQTGEYLSEIGLGGPLGDIQWHPKRPSILSTWSCDGNLQVHSVHDFGPSVTPSWLGRPAGVSFGFGGKLVSFGSSPSVKQASADGKSPPNAAKTT
eukprot:889029-Amorphochlora_amoeboformis.AAC.1